MVLPCLNEAEALPWVLGRLPDGYRAIVADNGSSDGSASVAAELGAHVVHVAQRGFGAACHAGIEAATSDVVAVMDADASLDPRELPAVTTPVHVGDADLVLGRRVAEHGALALHQRIGNLALAAAVSRRLDTRIHDIGPMRAFRRRELLELDLIDRRFGYPLEMLVAAGHAGWRVREVSVAYLRRTGRSKVTGTLRGTVRTVKDMSRVLRGA